MINATIHITRGRKQECLTVEVSGRVEYFGSYSPFERGECADLEDYTAYNENGHEVSGVLLSPDEVMEAEEALERNI